MNQTVNKAGTPVNRVLPIHELNARRRRKRALTQGKPATLPDANLETSAVLRPTLPPAKSNL
jgi:hypothetical protein